MASRRVIVLLCALVALSLTAFAPPAQSSAIDMTVDAGFGGRFRDNAWMPVFISVNNAGPDVEGRLVVRPETSGVGITNTYSTPVTLPNGANQQIVLYITARNLAGQVRVDLMDDSNIVLASAAANVRGVLPLDRLYAVVTDSAAGSVDLSGVRLGGYEAFQTNWRVEDIPDREAALHALDLMLFSDVDTAGLSSDQRTALTDWVSGGGHLVVTGGPGWQATAAGLTDLLPFSPEGNEAVEGLPGLAEWLRADSTPLDAQTVIATGSVRDDASILAATEAGVPLLVRWEYGAGTVDYLTADPNTAPLRGWDDLGSLWLALLTSVGPQPSWAYGFNNWELAANAVEILPGYNLLPDVLPLCGFLALYIALVGPLNYFVLARLNRRELAWVTIPLLILVFSALAWVFGFNLRGTEARLSQLSVVRAWPDSERAEVESLIGLLSPRRAEYNLTLPEGAALRPIPRFSSTNALTSGAQTSVEIVQSDLFQARDFLVDASFVAGFNASGYVDAPAISGSASMAYDGVTGQQVVRGSVRNESDQVLTDAVILARGHALMLDEPLAPGDVQAFDLALAGEGPPAPAFYDGSAGSSVLSFSSYYAYYGLPNISTVLEILGEDPAASDSQSVEAQEYRRRRLFLTAFIADFYQLSNNPNALNTASTGRGDSVFLAGWTDTTPLPVELQGANWSADTASLYLIELDTETVAPTTDVTIASDRFTWTIEDRLGLAEASPFNMVLQPGDEVVFRFTPLPDAVLDSVDQLIVRVQRANLVNSLPLFLYDWQADTWTEIGLGNEGVYETDQPDAFLGPQNAVLVRVNADDAGGYVRMERLAVEQRGRF